MIRGKGGHRMKTILSVVIAMPLLMSGMATAQTMYRCGSNYQDRPCDAGQKGKPIGRATGPSEAATTPASGAATPECRQRGQDSLAVVYAWEGGATPDRQIDEISRKSIPESRKSFERQLVADVYRQRGTAAAVRSRIEAECMKELEERARAAALADALMRSGARPPGTASAPAATTAAKATPQTVNQPQLDAKQQRCNALDAQLRGNQNQQRAGGSISTLEKLRNDQRELETQRQASAC